LLDHLLATAGVAGDRQGVDRQPGRHQVGIHQWPQQQDEGAGVATRVGDALGLAQPFALSRGQFGQAERPVGVGAVRSAGVDQAGARVVNHGRRLARGGIRQAQKGHVGGVEQAGPLGRVLAVLGIDAQQLDVAATRQVFVDAQAGGALLPVDVDLECHALPLAHNVPRQTPKDKPGP
jgi:hypothetical protein